MYSFLKNILKETENNISIDENLFKTLEEKNLYSFIQNFETKQFKDKNENFEKWISELIDNENSRNEFVVKKAVEDIKLAKDSLDGNKPYAQLVKKLKNNRIALLKELEKITNKILNL